MRITEHSVTTQEDARDITRRYARTFYFASFALPPEKRKAAYALYSFCRLVDNIADETADPSSSSVRLELMRRRVEEVYAGDRGTTDLPVLQETVHTFGIPKDYLLDLIDGVAMDIAGMRPRTFEDLKNYCYHVASVVGLMMTRILQPDGDDALPYAEDLGTAMQLTNILRDVGEDLRMHRVYLPSSEMDQWGVTEDDLRGSRVTSAFRDFMRFQISRARDFYAKANRGIALLPDDGSRYCVRLMSDLYSRILRAIEANDYQVFDRRAHVPLPSKLLLAGLIAVRREGMPYFLLDRARREAVRSDTGRHLQYSSSVFAL